MRLVPLTILLAWVAVPLAIMQGPPPVVEYTGVLDGELVANTTPSYVLRLLAPATADERARVATPLGESDQVYTVAMVPIAKTEYRAALVERPGGAFTLFADLNQDGKWAEDEAHPFGPSTDPDPAVPGMMETSFSVPLAAPSFYAALPVTVQLRRESALTKPGAVPLFLVQSSGVAIRGVVDIAGRKVRVLYTAIDLKTGAVDPTSRSVGADCNGDGVIDMIWYSPENISPRGRPAVFRIGQHYVSTSRVDAASRTIVMRSHLPSDYEIVELAVGAEIPDFAFVDFEGKPRTLSEFRGRHLLLEFWGSWCGPCIQRFPVLKEAYEKYRSRGFEILGMDMENGEGEKLAAGMAQARKLVADHGLVWPQARADSVNDLITRRFRIVPYPTYILLDPKGGIISFGGKGQRRLDGPALFTTLEEVLPRK